MLTCSRQLCCWAFADTGFHNVEDDSMRVALIAFCLVLTVSCKSQDPMTALANSHVEANEPKGELFDQYLKRDLTSYFCNDHTDCRVEYEYLRKGATQNGVSYPKYYLWAKCFTNGQLETEGAVRVAAVEQKYFDITHYISAKEIVASPDEVAKIFPAALVQQIEQKAKH